MSSREFNQDIGRAKKAAVAGPVVITNRGEPSHVLLVFDEYERLTGGSQSIVDLLGDLEAAAVPFEPAKRGDFSLSLPDLDV